MKLIAYLTDIHLEEPFPIKVGVNAKSNWEVILKDVKKRGISEIVLGGDLGEPETNQWLFKSISDFEISVTLGNHDAYKEVTKHFHHAAFNEELELYYAFVEGDFKRIYLDSSSGTISEKQSHWFENELVTNQKIMLFVHHAIFPVDTLVDRKHYLRGRERIQELLIKSEKDIAIFCGHYHMADKQQFGKIRQYISPAVSYQVIKEAEPIQATSDSFGYRIIRIQQGNLDTEIVRFKV